VLHANCKYMRSICVMNDWIITSFKEYQLKRNSSLSIMSEQFNSRYSCNM
jgi:hypothetical protein